MIDVPRNQSATNKLISCALQVWQRCTLNVYYVNTVVVEIGLFSAAVHVSSVSTCLSNQFAVACAGLHGKYGC